MADLAMERYTKDMPKGGREGLNTNYFEERDRSYLFVVENLIPNIGKLYDLKEEGSRVSILDKDGKVVFATDRRHFSKLREVEKVTRIYNTKPEDQDNS